MKKFLIGCGVVLLLIIALVIGGGIYVAMKVKSFSADVEKQVAQLESLNQAHPFAAPVPPTLDEERLENYFQIRRALIKMTEANPTIQKLMNSQKVSQMELLKIAFNFTRELVREFAGQLESRDMSPDEYMYYAREVYLTVSKGAEDNDPEMKQIYDKFDDSINSFNLMLVQSNQGQHQVKFDSTLTDLKLQGGSPTSADVELLKKYKDDLLDYPQLSFMELFMIRAYMEQQSRKQSLRGGATAPSGQVPAPASAP